MKKLEDTCNLHSSNNNKNLFKRELLWDQAEPQTWPLLEKDFASLVVA